MFPDIREIESKEKQLGFDSLSSDERIVFVIADAEFEIMLGGAWGYLHNSAGNNLNELVIALDKIGAYETTQAGQRLLDKLSEYRCAKNREERVTVLLEHESEFGSLIDDFNNKFQKHTDDWGSKLHDYFGK